MKFADLRQKMAAACEERKRLSGQFRNALTGLYDGEQVPTTDGEDMKKDEVLSWKDKVKQDPYVRKGTNIFGDMKRQRHYDYYKIALDASA